MADLLELRDKINAIDKEVIRLFEERMEVSRQVADFKIQTGKPVFDDIFKRLPVSVKVAFLGMLLATLMGLPLGVFSAVKQYSGADSFLRVASTVLVAMPTFWLAMLLILVGQIDTFFHLGIFV